MSEDIDKLLYYPHFCVAAVLATLILILMYFTKRNYSSTRNRLFFALIFVNLAASVVNISTFFVISFTERYPLWFAYACNLTYLFLYNAIAVLFLVYINSMLNVSSVKQPIYVFSALVMCYEAFIIFSSPVTHYVIYYDDDLKYQHGPLMVSLYLCAFIVVVTAIAMFLMIRKRFNLYQTFSVVGFFLGILISVLFQVRFPRIAITNFACSMAFFFLYTAFENPAYYLYGDTSCYNRRAFVGTVNSYRRRKKNYTALVINAVDNDDKLYSLGRSGLDILSERTAERLCREFGRNVFSININMFVLIEDRENSIKKDISRINSCYRESFITDVENEESINIRPIITVMPIENGDVDGQEMFELIQNVSEQYNQEVLYINDTDKRIAAIRRERELLRIIDNAIRNNGFSVYYQPILDVKENKFNCAEALIRLIDSEYGFISPEEFIPIAEKYGRINEIGDYVFREVCRFIRDSKIRMFGVSYIEINLSPVQCRKKNLADRLMGIIDEYMIEPEYINLEITETAKVENNMMEMLNELMLKLHGRGITFSLDDFGSGFSALNYLIRLPVDIVKIDKGILWSAMQDEESMVILKNTIKMVKEVGRSVVVEGVENEDMAGILRECGCDYMQGFLYSKPLSESEYVSFVGFYS